MNERIRELAEQANASETGYAYYRGEKKPENSVKLHSVDIEKFAELIVKDIMTLLPEDCQVEDGRHLYWVLKDRYGVE